MKRHAARALAVQSLYAAEFKGDEIRSVDELEQLIALEPADKEVESYAR